MTDPRPAPSPLRIARLLTDKKSNITYFNYSNGKPGDICIGLQTEEIATMKEVANKVNASVSHLALIDAIQAMIEAKQIATNDIWTNGLGPKLLKALAKSRALLGGSR